MRPNEVTAGQQERPFEIIAILKKSLNILRSLNNFMDAEEIAGKYSMKELRPIAKKYGVKTHCVKKIDVVRALPPDALEELEGE